MPQSTNLNVSPYYDDYASSKDFYRILFRPGYSIQSRELTTLQSVLQNQVESVGKYLLKEGSMVVPGEISLNTNYNYIKISSYSQGFTLSQFLGATLTGQTTGVVAKVLNVKDETSPDAVTFFVRYESSGTSNLNRQFQEGEILSTDIVGSPTAVVGITGSTRPTVYRPFGSAETTALEQSPATGSGSAVFVQEGIYYINGHFVQNASQTLIIDKYSTKPTARVGFLVQEDLISPEEDSSLNDNAAGFSNYAAPGAHRLKITLTLASRNLDVAVENNFIELLRVRNGVIERKLEKRDWDDIEEILARRTYDESGDYIVRNYNLEVKNHKDDGLNNGVYPLGSDGTHSGLTPLQSDDKIVAALSPGKAYVRGYEIESVGTKYKTFDRARTTLTRDRATVTIPKGTSLNIQNVYGCVDLDNINTSGVDTEAHKQVKFYDRFIDSHLGDTKVNRGGAPVALYILHLENLDAQATYDWAGGSIDGLETYDQTGGTSKVSIKSVTKITDQVPIGTLQYGTATTNACDQYQVVVSLNSGQSRPLSGTTVRDAQGGVTSSTSRSIVRKVDELNTKPIGCAHPKYLRNTSAITDSSGRLGGGENRESIFSLGLFDTSTFVTLKIHSNTTVGTYSSGVMTTGARITGGSSGATGIVEASYDYSGSNITGEITVSNVKGSFRDGEDLYTDPDYGNDGRRATARIIKNGTIRKIHVLDPGTGYSASNNPTVANDLKINGETVSIERSAGSFVFPYKLTVTSQAGLQEIIFDDGSTNDDIFPNDQHFQSSTAKTYNTVPTATIVSTGNDAKLSVELWDDCINVYTMKDIKSVYHGGGLSSSAFSADVITDNSTFYNFLDIGQITGKAGGHYFEYGNISADPTKLLKENDLIKVLSGAGERRYIVKYTRRSSPTVPARIYIYGSIIDDITSSTAVKVQAKFEGGGKSSLVFKCPDNVVKTTAKDKTKTGFTIKCIKQFISTVGNNGTLSFTESGENKDFGGYDTSNYIAIVADKATANTLDTGDILNLSSFEFSRTLASATNNSQVSWSGLPTGWHGAKIKLSAPITIKNAKPRTKILKNAQVSVSTFNKKNIINLGKTDGFRVNAIYMSKDPDATALVTDIDVKDRFIFDNGQRDNVYDIARVIRKAGAEEPSGQLLVDFDYFDHNTNDGEYFSVDSYINPQNLTMGYGDVPTYFSEKQGIIQLRDCVDFRPSADCSGSSIGKVAGAEDRGELGALNFTSVETFIPVSSDSVDFSYDFYLPRNDSIYLTKKGTFEIVQGVPNIVPQYPAPIQDAIRLFDLDVPAFTFNPKNVKIRTYNHRRYTMKDLRDIDKRLETMEYYTTLSLLEQDTLNSSSKDAVTGLDRFKAGIVVDNFAGHNVGDTFSTEYKCAIDMQSQQLRPQHFTNQVKLVENVTDDASRSAKGYKKSSSILTLDYTDQEMIKNPYATEVVNLNPFLVFQYKGTMQMNPDIDEWKDTDTRPDMVVQDNNLFNTIGDMADESGVLGTIWNEWQTSWSGSQVVASDSATSNASATGRDGEASVTVGVDTTVSTAITGRTRTRTRTGTRNTLSGFDTIRQSYGNRVVGVAFKPLMRSRPVAFSSTGLKPNTRLYAFFEGIDANAWVCPDSTYTGNALNSPKGFGQPIITDNNGSVSGILIIPNGHAPVTTFTTSLTTELSTRGISGDDLNRRRVAQSTSDAAYNYQVFTGNFDDIIYDTSSPVRQFRVGERTFRLTSSDVNSHLQDQVDTFAEHEYFAMGMLETSQRTIVSTRVPVIAQRSVSDSDQVQFIDGIRQNVSSSVNVDVTAPPPVINNITNITQGWQDPAEDWSDPVAQTFMVDGFEDGCFVSSLELFFKTKSKTVPAAVYLTETNQGTPGKKIIPFSEVSINPTTIVKVISDSPVNFVAGETVIGMTSGANGIVKTSIAVEGNQSTTNFSNTVYTLEMDNHNGKEFQEGETLSIQRFPAPTAVIKVAQSTYTLDSVEMTSAGSNYTSVSVTVSAPQQVGGLQATAFAQLDASTKKILGVVITNRGSGYTSEPSVSISGDGSGATAITKVIKESSAVQMGIGTSDDASVGTKFKFNAPVYLENRREYAFVAISNTTDYTMFISRLGENEIGTTQRVSAQPYLGSLFKSQNSTLWTADQFEDVKFTLNRAKFITGVTATVDFVNDKLPFIKLPPLPVETNKLSYRGGSSIGESIYTSSSAPTNYADQLFGSNPRIVRIHQKNHGMTEGDYVVLKGIAGVGTTNPLTNGIAINKLNTIHQILNVGLDDYCIKVAKDGSSENDQADESGKAGGSFVQASNNEQFQVVQPQLGVLQFATNNLTHSITTLKSSAVDFTNVNDLSEDSFAVIPGENLYLKDNYQILSEINEVYQNNGKKSLKYSVTMATRNDAVSPVIDLDRVNLFVTTNRIDRPSSTDSRFGYNIYRLYPHDNTPNLGGQPTVVATAANGGGNSKLFIGAKISNNYKVAATDDKGRDFVAGTLESGSSGKIEAEIVSINDKDNYIDIRYTKVPEENINSDGGGQLVLLKGQRFGAEDSSNPSLTPWAFNTSVSSTVYYLHTNPVNLGGFLYRNEEESGMGAHNAKYQTKVVTLENPASNIDVRLTANLFANNDVQVMYKIKPVSSDKAMGSQPWKYFNPKYTSKSSLRNIEVIDGGAGYDTAPTITIVPNNGVKVTPVLGSKTVSGNLVKYVKDILITDRGQEFTEPPEVVIDATTGGGGNGISTSAGITFTGAGTSGGTGYVDGTYTNQAVIYDTSSSNNLPNAGQNATATLVVSGGVVTTVTIITGGTGYTVGETLTVDNTFDTQGAGSGLKFIVASVAAGNAPTTLAMAKAEIFPVDFDEESSGLADDSDSIEIDDTDILDPSIENLDSYKDYKFTIEDLPQFDKFAVKIIMKMNTSKGPAFVPKIEDFRCIATA